MKQRDSAPSQPSDPGSSPTLPAADGVSVPHSQDPTFLRWCFLGALVLFFAIAMEYMRSDFWMDEIITLYDYAMQKHWRGILTQYPVANNHMLYSVVLWHWAQLNPLLSEEALRFPCLIFALIAIIVLHWQARRLFSPATALLMTMMFAFSPLFLAFFWQLRGYGLSMLLALIATLGCMRYLNGDRWVGFFMFVLPALVLPGVLPSNILINFSLVAYVGTVLLLRRELLTREHLPRWSAMALCGVIGMLIYLPVRDDFMRVMASTGGWQSGWLVAGHWFQSLGTHGGLICLALWLLRRRKEFRDVDWRADSTPLMRTLPVLLLCCAVPMLAMSLLLSPFPRAMLGYLAPLTFCLFIGHSDRVFQKNLYYYLLLFIALANVLIFHRMTDQTMRQGLRLGEYPQNLLQQYYTRNDDISTTARYLKDHPLIIPNSRIFIDVHFFHSMQLYWHRHEVFRSQLQLECLEGGEQFPLQENLSVYPYYPQFILAYDERSARRAYRRTLGLEAVLQPLPSPTPLRIFFITALALPDNRERMPDFMPPLDQLEPDFDPPEDDEDEPRGIPIRFQGGGLP